MLSLPDASAEKLVLAVGLGASGITCQQNPLNVLVCLLRLSESESSDSNRGEPLVTDLEAEVYR